jgi:uncharacterized protein
MNQPESPGKAAIRRLEPGDAAALLPVNNASAAETSEMTEQELAGLIGTAFFAAQAGSGDAFIIVLDERADYRSPNFLWFKQRYARFTYVDRVVTAAHARRRGLGRALYEAAIAAAGAAEHGVLGCEVNTFPANPGSESFHQGLGFEAIGEARHGPEKAVRYYARAL